MKEIALIEIVRLLAFALLTAYVIGVRKYDIESISHSDEELKNFKYLFEIVMFISGISIILTGFSFPYSLTRVLFICGGALIFGVGVFPKFRKNKFNEIAHSFCAIGGFFLTAVALIIMVWYIGVIVIAVTLIVNRVTKYDSNNTLTVELVVSYGLFIGLEISKYILR